MPEVAKNTRVLEKKLNKYSLHLMVSRQQGARGGRPGGQGVGGARVAAARDCSPCSWRLSLAKAACRTSRRPRTAQQRPPARARGRRSPGSGWTAAAGSCARTPDSRPATVELHGGSGLALLTQASRVTSRFQRPPTKLALISTYPCVLVTIDVDERGPIAHTLKGLSHQG